MKEARMVDRRTIPAKMNKEPRIKNDPMVGGTSDNESAPWGHGNFANMPQEVRMQEYPKMPHRELDTLDDTAGRISDDAQHAERGDRQNLDRGMY